MSKIVTLQPSLSVAATQRLIADIAAATIEGQTFSSRREAIVAIATALRAQHQELQEALKALRADPQTDPAQGELLTQLDARGCEVLVSVSSAIQVADRLLETLSFLSDSS